VPDLPGMCLVEEADPFFAKRKELLDSGIEYVKDSSRREMQDLDAISGLKHKLRQKVRAAVSERDFGAIRWEKMWPEPFSDILVPDSPITAAGSDARLELNSYGLDSKTVFSVKSLSDVAWSFPLVQAPSGHYGTPNLI